MNGGYKMEIQYRVFLASPSFLYVGTLISKEDEFREKLEGLVSSLRSGDEKVNREIYEVRGNKKFLHPQFSNSFN